MGCYLKILKMKQGDILIAKDECKMKHGDSLVNKLNALIVGKEYEVIFVGAYSIAVKSEVDNEHHFTLNKDDSSAFWGIFFELKK